MRGVQSDMRLNGPPERRTSMPFLEHLPYLLPATCSPLSEDEINHLNHLIPQFPLHYIFHEMQLCLHSASNHLILYLILPTYLQHSFAAPVLESIYFLSQRIVPSPALVSAIQRRQ